MDGWIDARDIGFERRSRQVRGGGLHSGRDCGTDRCRIGETSVSRRRRGRCQKHRGDKKGASGAENHAQKNLLQSGRREITLKTKIRQVLAPHPNGPLPEAETAAVAAPYPSQGGTGGGGESRGGGCRRA
ncbi:MAG TPA: hypothetical protein VET84_06305 [Stellaceae bacterium]|nr:hypothetical protein [Stellaceae bacterium]